MRRSIGARVAASVVVLLCAALTGAGCGSDDGGGGEAGKPVTLKVGVIPIADVAPLYLGINKGFFEEENLTIEPQLAEGGAAIVPAVMSGDYQIGFSNVDLADDRRGAEPAGQDHLRRACSAATTEDEAWDALLAPKGGVTDLKDLEGKKVSVNTLNNLPAGRVRNCAREGGRGLQEGQVRRGPVPGDGRGAGGQARRRGVRGRARSSARRWPPARPRSPRRSRSSRPNLTSPTYFTSKQYVAENEDVVERFTARDEQVARLRGSTTTTRCARSSASTPRSRRR